LEGASVGMELEVALETSGALVERRRGRPNLRLGDGQAPGELGPPDAAKPGSAGVRDRAPPLEVAPRPRRRASVPRVPF
jgi:hypothetical protein